MKSFAVLVGVAAAANVNSNVLDAFAQFQKTFEKAYDDSQFPVRLAAFADNLERVSEQNREHVLLGGEAVFGITKFSDLTPAEFKATYLTYIPRNVTKRTEIQLDGAVAATVDWRTKGVITPVKDQGQCGSCWAFSATEAIESYAALSGKALVALSPQQINSCDKVDGGCNGGNTETAYEYVAKAGGLESGADYPYTSGGGTTGTCHFDASKVAIKIKSYTSVAKGETSLQSALNNGPVSICLAADAFQSYRSGILQSCPGQVDHCVQAVGYDSGANYWIVRNSWGTSWGEAGYIRIAIGKDLCKISDDITFPTF